MSSIIDELQFRQNNLNDICQKPVPALRELTWINHQYGIGTLFRDYAGLPRDEPLTFSIDHGVPLEPRLAGDFDFVHGLPVFMNAYPERARYFMERGTPRAIPAALAIYYAKALLERKGWKPPKERKGTLAFPHKSAARTDRSFDFHAYGQWLVDLPEEFQPAVVCIYWKDYFKDRHLPYLELGLPVVSCGHFYDTEFLFRFVDLCSRFRFSCSNSMASSYPLSVACGCHFFHKDVGAIQESDLNIGEYQVSNPGEQLHYGAELKNFAVFPPRPEMLAEQRRLAKFVTGADYQLTPEEVRREQKWGQDWLLERQGRTATFGEKMELSEFNTWLPGNIHPDGWAAGHSHLTVRAQSKPSILRAVVKLSRKICAGEQTLSIRVGTGDPVTFDCGPKRFEINIPLEANSITKIVFDLPREVDISGEGNRLVAMRFLGWEIQSGHIRNVSCNQIRKPADLPPFLAADGRWQQN
jgi:hypothetical protein